MNIASLLLPVDKPGIPEDLSDMLARPYIYQQAGLLREGREGTQGTSTSPESSPNSTSPPQQPQQIKQESPPAQNHTPLHHHQHHHHHHHHNQHQQQQQNHHHDSRIPPISISSATSSFDSSSRIVANRSPSSSPSESHSATSSRYGPAKSQQERSGSRLQQQENTLLPPVKREPSFSQYSSGFSSRESPSLQLQQPQQIQNPHYPQQQLQFQQQQQSSQPHHLHHNSYHHQQQQQQTIHSQAQLLNHHQHGSQYQQVQHQQQQQQQQTFKTEPTGDKITLPSLKSIQLSPPSYNNHEQSEYKVPAFPGVGGNRPSQFLTQEQTPAQSPADTSLTSAPTPLALRPYPGYASTSPPPLPKSAISPATPSTTASTPIHISALLQAVSPAPTTPSSLDAHTPSRASSTPTPPTLLLPPHHSRSASRTPPAHLHHPRSPRHNPMTRPLRPAPSNSPNSPNQQSVSPQPPTQASATGIRKSKESDPCKFCDNKFSNDFGLRRHLKTKHRDKLYPEAAGGAGNGGPEGRQGGKPQEIYPCGFPVGGADGGGICTYSSPRKDHVLQHRRMRHHVVGRGDGIR